MPPKLPTRLETYEKAVYLLIETLIQMNARVLANPILKLLRVQRQDRVVNVSHESKKTPKLPEGPYRLLKGKLRCDLLLFVPRGVDSRLIDDVTGAYGYSHLTIDCGEVDVPTGKRVMFESMPLTRVHRSFQDEYGHRPYLRVPLQAIGVRPEAFYQCLHSRVGEQYDYGEALTWGAVDDPARQICSDLAAGCLPDEILDDIAKKRKKGTLPKRSVSVHLKNIWVSPNAFSMYLDAPKGKHINRPNHLYRPNPRHFRRSATPAGEAILRMLLLSLGLSAGAFLIWFYERQKTG